MKQEEDEGAVSGALDSAALWLVWKNECQEMFDNWLYIVGKPDPYIILHTKVNSMEIIN